MLRTIGMAEVANRSEPSFCRRLLPGRFAGNDTNLRPLRFCFSRKQFNHFRVWTSLVPCQDCQENVNYLCWVSAAAASVEELNAKNTMFFEQPTPFVIFRSAVSRVVSVPHYFKDAPF